jgi:hypothetical protein
MKILIIIPFFGECPKWITPFLLSCKYNPTISWLIYTDFEKPVPSPDNVHFFNARLSDFNRLSSEKLKLDINISNPYKICDLRPAFGVIFEEFLHNVDFWGYSDIDLIYGDIRSFITDEILNSCEIISTREEYMSGHFALYKNQNKINLLYQKCINYREIFQNNNHHYAFDERSNLIGRRLFKPGKNNLLKPLWSIKEKIVLKIKTISSRYREENNWDVTQLTNALSQKGELKIFRKNMVRSDLWFLKKKIKDWKIIWDSGELTDATNNQEILHFHLIVIKNNKNLIIQIPDNENKFMITREGISITNN